MTLQKRKALIDLANDLKNSTIGLAKLKTSIKEIAKNFNLNTKIKKGRTLLHYATMGTNYQIIPFLVKIGVNVNLCDDDFNTPLHLAIMKNSYQAVYELLKVENIDINALGEFDQTPLHKAVINGNLDIIKLLIKKGADYLMVDEKNQSPLNYAYDENDEHIITYLLALDKKRKENKNA